MSYRSLAYVFLLLAACHEGNPQLRVLGVQDGAPHEVVFVEVTNPASHVMRLTKLEYKFAAEGVIVSQGAVDLAREVPGGSAAVVEVPLDSENHARLTLSGRLTAELDQIVRTFTVSAQVQPH